MLRRSARFKLLIIALILMHNCECKTKIQPLGSILFEDHGFPKKCFIQNDIAQLATRLKFQELLPKNIELMNDDGIVAMIKYFFGINEIIEHMNQGEARQLVLKCFYDMLGSYLKHIILPITKYSFYTGNVTYSVAQNVFDLYERCKELLDTNGNGWSDPITDFSEFNIKIIPLIIPKTSDDEAMKACSNLVTDQNDDDEDMLVPLPKIETEENDDLSTIRFPLKRKHTFCINSRKSAFILLRYFVMVTQCFKYQGINQSVFNKKLNLWITDNVLPYLDDDQLYPAFGAVLRIIESIKSPYDATYQGSKEKKMKRQKQQLVGSTNLLDFDTNLNSDEFSFDNPNRDFNWWLNAVLASIGILVLSCLLIYMLIRICCNRKKVQEVSSNSSNKKKRKSLKEKIANALRSSTHMPEHDEFYEYKKITNKKELKFENEKSRKFPSPLRKFKQKNSKEQVNLPLLNAESEDEIVLHESKRSTPHSSLTSLSRKTAFKLSEESENESKPGTKNPNRFLQKIRPKSPLRKNRNG